MIKIVKWICAMLWNVSISGASSALTSSFLVVTTAFQLRGFSQKISRIVEHYFTSFQTLKMDVVFFCAATVH